MNSPGTVVPPFFQRECFHRIQQLKQRDATTGWRSHGNDTVILVCTGQGFAPDRLINFEILVRDQSVSAFHFGNDVISCFSPVKSRSPLIADKLECVPEVFPEYCVTFTPFIAQQEIRHDSVVTAQGVLQVIEAVCLTTCKRKSFQGQIDRRLHEIAPWKRSMT